MVAALVTLLAHNNVNNKNFVIAVSFLCLCQQSAAEVIPFWGCLCVHLWSYIKSLWTWESAYENLTLNCLGAVVDRDEVIRFWNQKVRGQGHDETTDL